MLPYLAGVAYFNAPYLKKKMFKVSTVPSTFHFLACEITSAVFVLIAGFIKQMTDTGQIKTVVRSYVGQSHY